MGFKPAAVTVSTSLTRLASQNLKRTSLTFSVVGSETIYVVDAEGTPSAQGIDFSSGQKATFAEEFGDDPTAEYFARTAASTSDVRVLEGFGQRPLGVRQVA